MSDQHNLRLNGGTSPDLGNCGSIPRNACHEADGARSPSVQASQTQAGPVPLHAGDFSRSSRSRSSEMISVAQNSSARISSRPT
jgi:hypothetical protein